MLHSYHYRSIPLFLFDFGTVHGTSGASEEFYALIELFFLAILVDSVVASSNDLAKDLDEATSAPIQHLWVCYGNSLGDAASITRREVAETPHRDTNHRTSGTCGETQGSS